jgi:hypothetical protein
MLLHRGLNGRRCLMAEQVDALSKPVENSFPPGLHNAYCCRPSTHFLTSVVLNSPMVLYAKTLGASATVLGSSPG